MPTKINPKCTYNIEQADDQVLRISIKGRLSVKTTGQVWRVCRVLQQKYRPKQLIIEATEIEYCDGAGISFFLELRKHQLEEQHQFNLTGLKEQFYRLYQMITSLPQETEKPPESPPMNPIEHIGHYAFQTGILIKEGITFLGEFTYQSFRMILNPSKIRWTDTWVLIENVGPDALPIIALLGFLIGVIMAFQAAIQMRAFGATIYVANLVGVALTRELGPLMTSIILTGRSASAFAAEIGTMKINQEVDALKTMGFEPLCFLAIPRLLAAMVMAPILNIFLILFGLIGGAIVMNMLGFSLSIYLSQLSQAVLINDFMGGILKTLIYSIIIAGIGCMHGLKTQRGAQAVGFSTTKAVVSGIIMLVIADGVLSALYYAIGL